MPFATIQHDAIQTTIVNTDQITYIRQDGYGTAIHFSSGEHVISPVDIERLRPLLFGTADGQGEHAALPENLLIMPLREPPQ